MAIAAMYEERYTVSENVKNLHDIIIKSVSELSWSIQEEKDNKIIAVVESGMLSWGEKVVINKLTDNEISIVSKCSLPIQFIDYGKNRKNVESLIEKIKYYEEHPEEVEKFDSESLHNRPALWNPVAAVGISLLFSSILGAWIHAINWRALKNDDMAKKSMYWMYGNIAFLILAILLGWNISILFLVTIAWYLVLGKKQINYIREGNLGYKRKSWGKPVLILLASWFCLFLISSMFSGSSDVNLVKGGVIGNYKSLTVGEAFDNCSSFKSTSWESFKAENGRKVVQFDGNFVLNDNYKKAGIEKVVLTIQFVVNRDDSFNIQYMELACSGKNKQGKEQIEKEKVVNYVRVLSAIYDNGNVLPALLNSTAKAVAVEQILDGQY